MPVSTLYITAASKQLETNSECVLIWLKSHTLIVILTSALSSSRSELCSSSFSANGWNHKEMAMFGQSNDLTWCHQCWGMYRISPAFKTTCNQHNPLIKERLLKFIFYKGWGFREFPRLLFANSRLQPKHCYTPWQKETNRKDIGQRFLRARIQAPGHWLFVVVESY